MTLDKAIEIISQSAHGGTTTFNQDFKDAQKLGIEALIRERNNRINPGAYDGVLLPGETEE